MQRCVKDYYTIFVLVYVSVFVFFFVHFVVVVLLILFVLVNVFMSIYLCFRLHPCVYQYSRRSRLPRWWRQWTKDSQKTRISLTNHKNITQCILNKTIGKGTILFVICAIVMTIVRWTRKSITHYVHHAVPQTQRLGGGMTPTMWAWTPTIRT